MHIITITGIICTVLFSMQAVTADVTGETCNITEVDDSDWANTKILGNFKQNAGLKVNWHAVTDVDSIAPCKELSISSSDHKNIFIRNKEDWTQYDKEDVDTEASPKIETCGCSFTCNKDPRSLSITYRIEDTNDYDPTFSKPSYEAEIPMPLIPKVDYTIFLPERIIVKDKDFSTSDMTFEIDPPDFDVPTVSLGKKAFSLQLVPKAMKRLDSGKTYIITATDVSADTIQRRSQATLLIKVNASQSDPDIPRFSQAFYKFKYIIKDGKGQLQTNEEMKVDCDSADVNLEITGGDLAQYIQHSFNKIKRTVSLTATDFPDAAIKDKDTVYLTLSAHIPVYNDSNNVSIIIDLPSKESPPEFKNAYYEYKYEKTGNIQPVGTNNIQVKDDATQAQIDPDDFYNTYLKLDVDKSDKTTYNVLVQDANALKKLEVAQITVNLLATKPGVKAKGTSALVVHLPIDQILPQFDKVHYSAKYNENKSISWIEGPIKITNENPKDVSLTLLGDFGKYFKLETTDSLSYTITVSNPPEEALKDGKPITLLIEAKLNEVTSHVSVALDLPPKTLPMFSQLYYHGTYNPKDNDIAYLNGPIKLTNTDADKTAVTLDGEDKNLFQIVKDPKDSSQINLSPKGKALPTDKKQFMVTLLATLNDAKNSSVVTITTTDAEKPEFSRLHYSLEYNNATAQWVAKDGPIELKNKNAKDTVVKVTDPTDIFDIEKSSTETQWNLKVKAQQLSAEQYVLTLEATLGDEKSSATAVVTVSSSKTEMPVFSQHNYIAQYVGKKGNLDFIGNPITMKNDHSSDTKLSLMSSEYSNLFKLSQHDSIWDVSVENPISNPQKDYVFTIIADLQGVKSEATLVVTTPDVEIPTFTNIQYMFTYDNQNNLNIKTGPIALANKNIDDTKVSLQDSYKKFQIVQDEKDKKTYQLSLIKDAVLDDPIYVITLEANLDKITAYATVIVERDFGEFPEFSSNYYISEYDIDKNAITKDPAITLTNKNAGKTDVSVIEGKEYVGVQRNSKDEKRWDIFVNVKELPPHTANIKAKLQAKLNNNAITSLLVIDLITEGVIVPRFSRVHYRLEYNSNTTAWVVKDGPITLINKNAEATVVEVIEPVGVFGIDKSSTKNQWDLKVIAPQLTAQQYVLTLEATLGEVKSLATAVVTVSSSKTEIPLFSQQNYIVKYVGKVGNLDFIGNPITIKNDHSSDTKLSLMSSDHSDLFKLSQHGSTWDVSVENPISNPQKDYVFTIIADLQGEHSQATLVVTTPDVEIPTFTNPQYLFTYDAKNNLNIKTGAIALANKNIDNTKVSLQDSYNKFQIVQDEKDKKTYHLSLIKDAILGDPAYALTLEAKLDEITTYATLIVEKDFGEAPKFSSNYYISEYDMDKKAITKDPLITLTNKNADHTDVSVVEGNEYVSVQQNQKDGKKWDINVKKIPPDAANIFAKLEAKLNGNSETSLLVMDLVTDSTVVPTFSKPLYEATYQDDNAAGNIITEEIQIISGNPADTNVEIKEYIPDLKIVTLQRSEKDPKMWALSAEKVPSNSQQLTLLLEATLKGKTGHSIVVVNFTNADTAPRFSKPFYEANYKVQGTKASVVLDSEINIEGSHSEEISIAISQDSEFREKFEVKNNHGKINLTVKNNLDTSSLKRNVVVIVLEASRKNLEKATASVVISVPGSNGGNSDSQKGDSESSGKTGMLAAIGVLVFIVLACFGAIGTLYCLKIRKRSKYGEMDDDDSMNANDVRFSKNTKIPSLNGRKSSSSIAARRPTGFIRYPSALKEKDDAEAAKEESIDVPAHEEPKERRKSVAFDENVSKLQIEPIEPVSPEEVVTTQL